MEKMEESWEALEVLEKNSHNFTSNRLKQLVRLSGDANKLINDEDPYYEDEDDQSTFEGLLPDIVSHLREFKSYIKWVNNTPVPQKGLVQYFDDLQN